MNQGDTSGWYFGWNIVAVATVLTLLTVGMRLGIGPFFLPMANDLGFSRSLLAGIVAVGMLCYGLAMPLAGYLVAQRGTRFVLVLGTALVVVATVWTLNARGPVGFLLSFGVLLSVGLGFTSPVALTPVLSRWFTRRRGMALFFLSTGSMAGMAVLTPLLAFSIERFGWQATLGRLRRGLRPRHAAGGMVRHPRRRTATHRPAARPDRRGDGNQSAAANASAAGLRVNDAVRTSPFWKVCLGLFACGFSMNLLGTHGMPMLMDHGFDATTSAMGIGTIGLVAIAGTLVLGRLSDRLPRRNLLAGIYSVRGLGFFALMVVGTHWELYPAASRGRDRLGRQHRALVGDPRRRVRRAARGRAVRPGLLSHQLGATISSWLGGWGFDTFGSHWLAFGTSGALLLLAALVSLQLPPRGFSLAATGRPAYR